MRTSRLDGRRVGFGPRVRGNARGRGVSSEQMGVERANNGVEGVWFILKELTVSDI